MTMLEGLAFKIGLQIGHVTPGVQAGGGGAVTVTCAVSHVPGDWVEQAVMVAVPGVGELNDAVSGPVGEAVPMLELHVTEGS
jgi:hypothetical protein